MPASLPPFQQLLDRHAEDVLGYLIAMVGPNEADDCFQETFLAALRAYPGLRDGRNLKGWLFTIAHNKAIDSHRKAKLRPTPSGPPDELVAMAEAISGAVSTLGGRPGDNGEVEGPAESFGPLSEAVEALPQKQRAAVMLRFGADLSHREIAAAIECSEAAARRNLHEGLNKLREVWR